MIIFGGLRAFFCFREGHIFTYRGGTYLLLRDAQLCLSKIKTNNFFCFRKRHVFTSSGDTDARGTIILEKEFFFASMRDTNLLPQVTQLCLSNKEKQNMFIFFRGRHGFAFARQTCVSLQKRKRILLLPRVFL